MKVKEVKGRGETGMERETGKDRNGKGRREAWYRRNRKGK